MVTEYFDAAEWLAKWTAAGGGWANRTLLLPPENRRALAMMVDDLSPDEVHALADYLGVEEAA